MRSNRNPSGSVTRSVGDRAGSGKTGPAAAGAATAGVDERTMEPSPAGSQNMLEPQNTVGSQNASQQASPNMVSNLSLPRMPVEWLDSANWRLPSGKALAEFALQAGFLAPLLFGANGFGKAAVGSGGSSRMPGSVAPGRGKEFGKGESR